MSKRNARTGTTPLAPERCEYPKGLMNRALVNEAKGLRIDCNQPPYRDELRNNCNGASSVDKWFPQASELQKLHASMAHERAKQFGMDVRNLILDLRQGGKDRTWRDDGLLPHCPAGLGCLLPPRKRRAYMAITTTHSPSQKWKEMCGHDHHHPFPSTEKNWNM